MALQTSLSVLFLTVFFNILLVSFGAEDSPCYVKFENEETHKQISMQCLKKIKPKIASDYPNATTDEELLRAFVSVVMNPDKPADDKCYMQCVLEQLGIITTSGELDKIKFRMKSNASETYSEAMYSIWSSCADTTVELAKPEGGFKSNLCKFSMKLRECVVKDVMKSADKLKKAC